MTTISITPSTAIDRARGAEVFERIVVGIDGSAQALEAARQAAILADAEGTLTALAAWSLLPPVVVPFAPQTPLLDVEQERGSAEAHVAEAAAVAAASHRCRTRTVQGPGWQGLLDEIAREYATLVAVGAHGSGRFAGLVAGSTATELIHRAPCSVLVARGTPERFPGRIVVGVDGTPQSARAYATAEVLAARFDVELWPVVAHGRDEVDRDRVDAILGHRREDSPDRPTRALVAASTEADLLVVGSRGLHGVRSLGSVSERVAHQARCSTLIVREPGWRSA